jgi:hypothetical protein
MNKRVLTLLLLVVAAAVAAVLDHVSSERQRSVVYVSEDQVFSNRYSKISNVTPGRAFKRFMIRRKPKAQGHEPVDRREDKSSGRRVLGQQPIRAEVLRRQGVSTLSVPSAEGIPSSSATRKALDWFLCSAHAHRGQQAQGQAGLH